MEAARGQVGVHIVPPPGKIVNNSSELFASTVVLTIGSYTRSIHCSRYCRYDARRTAAAFEV